MPATPSPRIKRPGVCAVHSIDCVVYTVPDLAEAERYYTAFGLDARREGDRLQLRTHGNPHVWMSIAEAPGPKKLQYLRFGMYAEDEAGLRDRVDSRGLGIDPHPMAAGDVTDNGNDKGNGIWLRNPDGLALQIVVADKVSPAARSQNKVYESPTDRGAAPCRSKAGVVHPRRLSHLLLFTPDVLRGIAFHEEVLGLRLSDRSEDGVAFLHGAHASDHHLLAFAKSHATGLHHTSWDVGSFHEVGLGSEIMREHGYRKGWGVGRHVLGSNYFYYVADPWGSWTEYSFDIDFVSVDTNWPATNHPPEDSFYVWGPDVPESFVTNHEAPLAEALLEATRTPA